MAWETRTYRATYTDGRVFDQFDVSGNDDRERDASAKRSIKDAVEAGRSGGEDLTLIRIDVPAVKELTTHVGTVYPRSSG